MKKEDFKPIVRTYYEELEKGNILGRKCTRCGHIEFPPYLCCNACGCVDTEWVNLNDMRGKVNQVLPTVGAFGDPDFRKKQGDYWAIGIEIPDMDIFCSSLLHVDADRFEDFTEAIYKEDIYVKPLIIQDEDVKVVVWELEDDSEFKKIPEIQAEPKEEVEEAQVEQEAASENKGDAIDAETDPVAQTVLDAAAMAYGVEKETLTLSTDIREDLSNESMKMIVMISEIEDELGVTIEIQEASLLNTLMDFVNSAKEKLQEA